MRCTVYHENEYYWKYIVCEAFGFQDISRYYLWLLIIPMNSKFPSPTVIIYDMFCLRRSKIYIIVVNLYSQRLLVYILFTYKVNCKKTSAIQGSKFYHWHVGLMASEAAFAVRNSWISDCENHGTALVQLSSHCITGRHWSPDILAFQLCLWEYSIPLPVAWQ